MILLTNKALKNDLEHELINDSSTSSCVFGKNGLIRVPTSEVGNQIIKNRIKVNPPIHFKAGDLIGYSKGTAQAPSVRVSTCNLLSTLDTN